MNTVGDRLKYVRTKVLKITQGECASILGMSQGALSDVESNNRGLSQEAIIALIQYSKQDILFPYEWILTGIETKSYNSTKISTDEQELIDAYRKLTPITRNIIRGKISEFVYDTEQSEKFKKSLIETATTSGVLSRVANDNNLVKSRK